MSSTLISEMCFFWNLGRSQSFPSLSLHPLKTKVHIGDLSILSFRRRGVFRRCVRIRRIHHGFWHTAMQHEESFDQRQQTSTLENIAKIWKCQTTKTWNSIHIIYKQYMYIRVYIYTMCRKRCRSLNSECMQRNAQVEMCIYMQIYCTFSMYWFKCIYWFAHLFEEVGGTWLI